MKYDLLKNCVGRYKLSENTDSTVITDSSGRGNHGVAVRNTNLLHNDSGIMKSCMLFNDTSTLDYITLKTPTQYGLGDEFSIAFWCKRLSSTPSTFTHQAESYHPVGCIGDQITDGSATVIEAVTTDGTGMVYYEDVSSDIFGPINFYPQHKILTKPGSGNVALLEIIDNNQSITVASKKYTVASFTDATSYWSYQTGSCFCYITQGGNYSIKVTYNAEVDYRIDHVAFDIYHRSPFGNSGSIAFWRHGQEELRVETVNYGAKTAYSGGSSANTWYFMVGTFSRSNQQIKLYRNGVLKATTSLGGDTTYKLQTSPLYIGSKSTSAGNANFNGYVDDVMLFNKVLSLEEIVDLYNSGKGTENLSGSDSLQLSGD